MSDLLLDTALTSKSISKGLFCEVLVHYCSLMSYSDSPLHLVLFSLVYFPELLADEC